MRRRVGLPCVSREQVVVAARTASASPLLNEMGKQKNTYYSFIRDSGAVSCISGLDLVPGSPPHPPEDKQLRPSTMFAFGHLETLSESQLAPDFPSLLVEQMLALVTRPHDP